MKAHCDRCNKYKRIARRLGEGFVSTYYCGPCIQKKEIQERQWRENKRHKSN